MYIIEVELGSKKGKLYFSSLDNAKISYNNLKDLLQGQGLKGKLSLYSAGNCIMATLL